MIRWLEVTWLIVLIDNLYIEQSGDSLYEGGDINNTIPPNQVITRWLEMTRAMVFIDDIDIEMPGNSL